MKTVFVFILFAALQPNIAFGEDCIDVTGDYEAGFTHPTKGKLIWSHRQDECKSVATGSFYLRGSEISDETPPTIDFVRTGMNELCEVSQCKEFVLTENGLEYELKSSIKINASTSCNYSKVEMSLKDQDLVRTFFIDDSSLKCRDIESFDKVFKRVEL